MAARKHSKSRRAIATSIPVSERKTVAEFRKYLKTEEATDLTNEQAYRLLLKGRKEAAAIELAEKSSAGALDGPIVELSKITANAEALVIAVSEGGANSFRDGDLGVTLTDLEERLRALKGDLLQVQMAWHNAAERAKGARA